MSTELWRWLVSGGIITLLIGFGKIIQFLVNYKRETDERIAKQLKERNEELEKRDKEWELKYEIIEVELQRLVQINNFYGFLREKVYVLDDQPIVTKAFDHFFSKITSVDCKTFNDGYEFIDEVNKDKPPIVIIDHNLGDLNGRQVLNFLEYKPAIIIMSGTEDVIDEYEELNVEFFLKDKLYYLEIARRVVEHIHQLIHKK